MTLPRRLRNGMVVHANTLPFHWTGRPSIKSFNKSAFYNAFLSLAYVKEGQMGNGVGIPISKLRKSPLGLLHSHRMSIFIQRIF